LLRRFRSVIMPLAAISFLVTGGCTKSGPKMVKVSGIVRYKDGTMLQVPEKGMASITFEPVDLGAAPTSDQQPRKGAGAKIKPDGTFELSTVKLNPPDGVIPGKYRVKILALRSYTNPSTVMIPLKYTDSKTSGFEETIDKPRSDLLFELDKQ
jgi:hypothetical protein